LVTQHDVTLRGLCAECGTSSKNANHFKSKSHSLTNSNDKPLTQ
jgi:hypothetical protein